MSTAGLAIANDFTGDDIGAQANAAFASLAGGVGHVVILPGDYAQSTQIIVLEGSTLHINSGEVDQYDIAGVPAILMQDDTAVVGVGDASCLQEPQFYTPGEYSISIGDFNSWNGGKDATRQGNKNLLVKDLRFTAQSGGAEITSTTSATVNFFNVTNAETRHCYFEGTHSFGVCYGGGSTGGYHADRVRAIDNVFEGVWSQNLCSVNANNLLFFHNIFTDTTTTAVTYIDVELNQTIDVGLVFEICDNIFNILPNAGNVTQPGAAIQVAGHVEMLADLTQPYVSNVSLGRICGNVMNGGPYPVAALPQLSQGIFANHLTNTEISGNVINDVSNDVITLAYCRGCKVLGNHVINSGSEGPGIWLSGSQHCKVIGNHLINDNYNGEAFSPTIQEENGNGAFNFSVPVASDFNFIHDNDLAFYPWPSSGEILSERQAFISTVGPNTRRHSNRVQGMIVDDAALQSVSELRTVPYPGTSNVGAPPIARLVGLLAPGDGGGATWVWAAASTATDNGATVVAPTNPVPSGAAGRWLRGMNQPSMSSTARDAITWTTSDAGMIIFNTTSSKLQCWDGTTWQNLW